MIDGIPLDVLGPLGGLLVVVFLPYIQMARGKLVPRSALDDEREDTEIWRQAHGQLSAQVSELLEHARTTDALLRAIAKNAEVPP